MTTTANFSSTAQCIDVLEGLQTLVPGSVVFRPLLRISSTSRAIAVAIPESIQTGT